MRFADLFYLHKSDRIVACFLIVIAAVAAMMIYLLGGDNADIADSNDKDAASSVDDAGNGTFAINKGSDGTYSIDGRTIELFPFDPNTADSTALLRLGLQPWMVRNIYKYRAAGGVYRCREDFARLYGLTKKQYEILAPYIHISDDYRAASDFYAPEHDGLYENDKAERHETIPRDTMKYPIKLRPGEHVAVNAADTTQLKKIPGVGSSFARAIVRLRDRLGGYSSAGQLMEIDGFPQEALAYVHIDASQIRRMNLNKMTYSQLRQHPYINFYQARDIIDYRHLKGNLKSLADLRLMKSFTVHDIERLKPYVEF